MQSTKTRLGQPDSGQQGDTLRKDRIHEVLSNPRRRQVIRYLKLNESEEEVPLRELADQIAAWENGVTVQEVTYKQRKRVYTSLYQTHLQKLHRYGFIEYNRDRGLISRTPEAAVLESYLDLPQGHSLPWCYAWFGASLVGAGIVLGAYQGLVPWVSEWQASLLVVGLFLSLAVVNVASTQYPELFGQ